MHRDFEGMACASRDRRVSDGPQPVDESESSIAGFVYRAM